jgi:CBS domain containing-hemolysin-like protein
VTYLSVVLGELVPKALTLERAEALAIGVARPIEMVSVLLRPAVWMLEGSATLLLRPFGIREVIVGETIRSADELRALVDKAEARASFRASRRSCCTTSSSSPIARRAMSWPRRPRSPGWTPG